jgi:hypothetical protein
MDYPVLTFGKYAGHDVRYVVDANRGYALWLFARPFFRTKYPKHYAEVRRLLVKRLTAEIKEEEESRELEARPRGERFKLLSADEFCNTDLV